MEKKTDFHSNSPSETFPVTLPHFKDMKKRTMAETFQYLNKLIGVRPAQEFENLSELLSSETSLFETRLKLILINSLHLENEVLKVLLSQDDYQIKGVLRCKWFFQNLSLEHCANQLFPYISVRLRCKIITRLSKYLRNSEEAEKYFTFIRNNYENERAEYLLPICSPEFILNYVEKVNPMFDHNNGLRVLLNICMRHVELGIHILSLIFETKKCYQDLRQYKRVLFYLAGYHTESFAPFFKKYCSCMPPEFFGRKLTKKLKSRVKENLFTDVLKNFIFKDKHLFPILTFEEKVKMIAGIVNSIYKELTFRNWRESNYRLSELLKLMPAKDRLKMVESAFNEVYNLNYNDHPNCWFPEVLELVPMESRQSYVIKLETILNTEVSDRGENERDITFDTDMPERLFYLYDSSTAFEKLKKIIRKTPSVRRREEILSYMVKNCSINNDTKILQEMVEFMAVHHRNDDAYTIYRIINLICERFPSSSMHLNIFQNLKDLMYFFILKGHMDSTAYISLMIQRMYFLIENNMSIDSCLEDYFKVAISKWPYINVYLPDFKSKRSKTLILTFFEKTLKLILDKSSTDETKKSADYLFESLLRTLGDYNKWKKRDPIFLKDIPRLDEVFKLKLKEKCKDIAAEEWFLDILEKYSFDIMVSCYNSDCLLYFSKQNPDLIDRHLKGILTMFFMSYSSNYCFFSCNLSKKCINDFMMAVSFLEKTEKVKEIILEEFKNGNSIERRKYALRFYSLICTVEEFNEVVERYLPQQEKVQQKSEDDFDSIQIIIPRLIKNIRPRWKNLELCLKFFFGDFLKSVLSSFYCCCYHMRYDYVIPFLKKQLDTVSPQVSYRLAIIRLILELSDREEKLNFSQKCWDEYKHYSVRRSLLLHVSKVFLEVQNKKSFQILEKCILDCDTQVIESKPDLQKIPNPFWNDYVSTLWRFSEKQKNPFRNRFRESILSRFNRDNISLLSSEFCWSVIEDNLFNPKSELKIYDFTVSYLVADSEAVELRLRMVLDLIKNRSPNSRVIYDFVNVLIMRSLGNSLNFAELFGSLLENWPEFPNGVLFEERVLLNYYFLYHKVVKRCSDSETVPLEFGKELAKFYSSADGLSDLAVVYAKALNNFFSHMKTFEAILVVKELVEGSRDRSLAVVAILSMPMQAVIWYKMEDEIFDKTIIECKKALNCIVKTLEGYDDRIVEIYLRGKFDFVK